MWDKFWKSFHDSEVIFWTRLQVILLPVLFGLHTVDWSPFITDKHILIGYIAFNAIFTEILRRHREDWTHYDDPDPPGSDPRP